MSPEDTQKMVRERQGNLIQPAETGGTTPGAMPWAGGSAPKPTPNNPTGRVGPFGIHRPVVN